jgi:hypothetical protein
MSEFTVYGPIGFWHVLDVRAYDHLLFLLVLMLPFSIKEWKHWLLLVSLFTLGHTLSLILSVWGVIRVNSSWIEQLILCTILLTAIINLIHRGKNVEKKWMPWLLGITFFFGLIHGLGFSNFFTQLLPGRPSEKMWPMMYFALGVEAAQLVIVFGSLLLSFLSDTLLKFTKRDWILMMSSFVIGVVACLLTN